LPGGLLASGIASVTWFGEMVLLPGLGTTNVITVSGDTDGDGAEDFRLYLNNSSGSATLTDADFLLLATA